jgi:hypothetical protein
VPGCGRRQEVAGAGAQESLIYQVVGFWQIWLEPDGLNEKTAAGAAVFLRLK